MRTAYKCRAYPVPEQVSVLNRTFGCVRVVWNRTLTWRQARYRGEHVRTSYTQANAYLTAMKASQDLGWLNEVSSVPLQQATRHQQAAFSGFFAGRARYDRDINAAKNILAAGLAVSACGGDVRHPGSPGMRSPVKQEPRPARAGIPVPQGGE